MRRRTALVLATLTLALDAGCDFTSFDTFRSHAPIVTFDPPEGFTDRQSSLVKVIAAQAAEVMALAPLRQPAASGDGQGFTDLRDLLGAS